MGSLADYSDLERFEQRVLASKAIGLKGAALIHPSQVAIANAGFSSTEAEIELALTIVEQFELAKATGKGAIAVAGRMVDEPVYQRAKSILARQRR
ncbi:L-malyl-CoA/beta-methylmalyl-CoA lyase [compost metagenome]